MSFDLIVLIALLFSLALITSGALIASLIETWTSTHKPLAIPAYRRARR